MKKIGKKALFGGLIKLIFFIIALIFLVLLIKNEWNVLDAINGMSDLINNILNSFGQNEK